jgi:hypothetical protein
MTDHPILFKTDMVNAILDGRKTQTRRPLTRLKHYGKITNIKKLDDSNWFDWIFQGGCMLVNGVKDEKMIEYLPYQPGDNLWVRETFTIWDGGGHKRIECLEHGHSHQAITYKAECSGDADSEEARKSFGVKYTPSIHMPRWASRLTLSITRVRVARVQDISEADAKAEGIITLCNQDANDPRSWWHGGRGSNSLARTPVASYEKLWDSCYAERGLGWDSNPWVIVIEYDAQNSEENS